MRHAEEYGYDTDWLEEVEEEVIENALLTLQGISKNPKSAQRMEILKPESIVRK